MMRDLVFDARAFAVDEFHLIAPAVVRHKFNLDGWRTHCVTAILAYCYITSLLTKPEGRRRELEHGLIAEAVRVVDAKQFAARFRKAVDYSLEAVARSDERLFAPFLTGEAPVAARTPLAFSGIDQRGKPFLTDAKLAYATVLWALLETLTEQNRGYPVLVEPWMLESSYLQSEFMQLEFFRYWQDHQYFLVGRRLIRVH